MKHRPSIVWIALLLLLVVAGVAWRWRARPGEPAMTSTGAPTPAPARPAPAPATSPVAAVPEPRPGQGRAVTEAIAATGGVLAGRVVNWSTGEGVAGAELTFTAPSGASTVRTRDDGGFELAPSAPGRFVLATIAAPGFLPYAPELQHSSIHVTLAGGHAVRGLIVFLFPAIDYQGAVVDARGAPAPGARVRLVGTAGEQAIDRPATEWTADRDGRFTFHAADDAVLEAVRGAARGWARLDGSVAITRQLTITLGDVPARDATITGRTVDATGAPLADVLVRASPAGPAPGTRSTVFATSGADGGFALAGLDRAPYDLDAEAEDHAPAALVNVPGGTRDVTITLDGGLPLAGAVVDGSGHPVPAYTLVVVRRAGAARHPVLERSVAEPRGRFALRVTRGDYELRASAAGWAPSPPTAASAGATDVQLVVSAGATLRGAVVASADARPLAYARVMRETLGGGASAAPANAGTVTRPDGTFELTGLPPGPLSITVAAGGYHPKIEAAMTASDGAILGPIRIALDKLADGERPSLELVGIGVALSADGDALRVDRVIAQGGAEAAGIVVGDHVIAIDGAPVGPLGVEGAVARIRGVAGTTLAIRLRRGAQDVELVVQRRKLRA